MPEGAGDNLLLFGASTRAAALSALRAGLRPWCADLFADADLQARCPVMRLTGHYPHGFLDLLDTGPPGAWMYTGGLENWPRLVERMAQRRPLWGMAGRVLARARNPGHVAWTLQRAGLPAPAVKYHASHTSPACRWLVKPLKGAGGSGIHYLTDESRKPDHWPATEYFQEYIEGEPHAALYVGAGHRACFLGLTRQLIGESWLHARPFQYCGSIGPMPCDAVNGARLDDIGQVLAARFGLRGLFGVDGILRDGVFWPVEINPRYTASVEVLEYATGLKAVAAHRTAFLHGTLHQLALLPGGCIGKAILFARAPLVFPAEGPWTPLLHAPPPVDVLPAYADIPAAGSAIEARRPILTFFARGDSPEACEAALRQTAADLDRRLYAR